MFWWKEWRVDRETREAAKSDDIKHSFDAATPAAQQAATSSYFHIHGALRDSRLRLSRERLLHKAIWWFSFVVLDTSLVVTVHIRC